MKMAPDIVHLYGARPCVLHSLAFPLLLLFNVCMLSVRVIYIFPLHL